MQHVEPDAHALAPAVDGEHLLERGLEREPLAVAAEPARRSTRAAPAPPRARAQSRPRAPPGSADSATKPFSPSSTSSARRVVGPVDDDRRRPDRRGLDDDEPVPLAPRREEVAQRAPQRLATVSAATKPGAATAPSSPLASISRKHLLAVGPVAEDRRRAAPGSARARSATARHDRRRLLLGDVPPREDDERLRRQRLERPPAGKHRSPSTIVISPRWPSSSSRRRAAARSRGRVVPAPRGQPLRPASRTGPRPRPGTRASTRASRPRTSRRRAGSGERAAPRAPRAARRGAPASGRRRSARRGRAGAGRRRRRSEAAREMLRRPRRRAPSRARPRPRRRPARPAPASGSHWSRVRYVTVCPRRASPSARARYQRSAPPTVYGYRQSKTRQIRKLVEPLQTANGCRTGWPGSTLESTDLSQAAQIADEARTRGSARRCGRSPSFPRSTRSRDRRRHRRDAGLRPGDRDPRHRRRLDRRHRRSWPSGAGARVVRLPFNLGIGGAMQTGFRYALEHGFDVAVQVDGDGQHDPARARRSCSRRSSRDRADMVVGVALRAASGPTARRSSRRLGIALLARIVSLIVRQRVTDTTSGFRAVNRHGIALFAADYPHDYPEVEATVMVVAPPAAAARGARRDARPRGRPLLDHGLAVRLLHDQGAAGDLRRASSAAMSSR